MIWYSSISCLQLPSPFQNFNSTTVVSGWIGDWGGRRGWIKIKSACLPAPRQYIGRNCVIYLYVQFRLQVFKRFCCKNFNIQLEIFRFLSFNCIQNFKKREYLQNDSQLRFHIGPFHFEGKGLEWNKNHHQSGYLKSLSENFFFKVFFLPNEIFFVIFHSETKNMYKMLKK